jgi:D-2-hydroxyacid dehydrogenase (NADP+)
VPRAVRAQDERQWLRFPARLLHHKTVGIFGIGAIAEELGPKCKAFGMRVVGVSSAPRPVAGFDHVHRSADLAKVAGEFDFFVLLTPLTDKTRNSVNAEVLAAMKPASFLVNLARGGVVDEPALIEALKRTHCRGGARRIQRGAAAAGSAVLGDEERHHNHASGRLLRCLYRLRLADRREQLAVLS